MTAAALACIISQAKFITVTTAKQAQTLSLLC